MIRINPASTMEKALIGLIYFIVIGVITATLILKSQCVSRDGISFGSGLFWVILYIFILLLLFGLLFAMTINVYIDGYMLATIFVLLFSLFLISYSCSPLINLGVLVILLLYLMFLFSIYLK